MRQRYKTRAGALPVLRPGAGNAVSSLLAAPGALTAARGVAGRGKAANKPKKERRLCGGRLGKSRASKSGLDGGIRIAPNLAWRKRGGGAAWTLRLGMSRHQKTRWRRESRHAACALA